MTGMRAIAVALAIILTAPLLGPASAGAARLIVCPNTGTLPKVITLVGTNAAGTPDPAGQFTVVVRDCANNPIPGALVTVDFSGASDLRIASSQPGLTVDCGGKRVTGVADQAGTWRASIVGSAVPGAVPSQAGAVHIDSGGAVIGHVTVAALDLDGAVGVAANDFGLWLRDFASGVPAERADYDGSGTVGANDLSLWLYAFGIGGSSMSGATCP